MSVHCNSTKKSKATPSLSYTLRPEVKDADMVEALYQIDEQFNPAIPENCLGGTVAKASPSTQKLGKAQTFRNCVNLSLKSKVTPGQKMVQGPRDGK